MVSRVFLGITFVVITFNQGSLQIPLQYIHVVRLTNMTIDVLLEGRIVDHWNVDGDQMISGLGTGFSQFIILSEEPPSGYTWSGERLTKFKQHPGPVIYGWKSGNTCRNALTK